MLLGPPRSKTNKRIDEGRHLRGRCGIQGMHLVGSKAFQRQVPYGEWLVAIFEKSCGELDQSAHDLRRLFAIAIAGQGACERIGGARGIRSTKKTIRLAIAGTRVDGLRDAPSLRRSPLRGGRPHRKWLKRKSYHDGS